MRLIDADALEKEGWSLHRTIRVDKNTSEYQTKPLKQVPTIEPERKKGKWNTYYHSDIDFSYSCNQCGYSAPYQMIGGKVFQKKWNFCPNCGADMREVNNESN